MLLRAVIIVIKVNGLQHLERLSGTDQENLNLDLGILCTRKEIPIETESMIESGAMREKEGREVMIEKEEKDIENHRIVVIVLATADTAAGVLHD